MKVTVIGAAGVRTPFMLQSFIARQERLGLDELALMDVDGSRLQLMSALTAPIERASKLRFRITWTTDPGAALAGATFVITTFRIGGIAARAVDERVALDFNVVGQETTGPGGYAMGLRTIPPLLVYVRIMQEVCPDAWLINFANPAGMLAEAVLNHARGGWPRAVGICDTPGSVQRQAAAWLGAEADEVFHDYFGLNHLGWTRAIWHAGRDHLPELLAKFQGTLRGNVPSSCPPDLLPNEYLYFYYNHAEAVKNLKAASRTRGEQLAALNEQLWSDLERLWAQEDFEGMQNLFQAYHHTRDETYFAAETGGRATHKPSRLDPAGLAAMAQEGYSGVALNLMEALGGGTPRVMILNTTNRGAVAGMRAEDVVEIPCYVGKDLIRPLSVGAVPDHCLGLMKQVKEFERLTIEAALQGSYAKALQALALHPLTPDLNTAQAILDEYIRRHGALLPALT